MRKYAVLCQPQVFKIYKDDAQKILSYEAEAVLSSWEANVSDICFEQTAGIWYLTFQTESEPSKANLKSLSHLSVFYAVFEVKGDMLLPVEALQDYLFKENMPALLNYQGKTNALFTRLMINLALCACDTNSEKMSLLDPVAGKGTTLYDAMMLNMNAYGIEISQKLFEESCHYAAKFMQKEKFKHTTKKDKVLDIKSVKISDAYTLEFAPDKKAFAAKDTGTFKMFSADSRIADRLLKKNSMDIIVGDLPYGIQHATKKGAKGSLKRSAEELFREAMPKWHAVLKSGGSLVMSFNEHTTHKKNLENALAECGMEVLHEDKYSDYHHRVDSSIIRNIIVAIKPK